MYVCVRGRDNAWGDVGRQTASASTEERGAGGRLAHAAHCTLCKSHSPISETRTLEIRNQKRTYADGWGNGMQVHWQCSKGEGIGVRVGER